MISGRANATEHDVNPWFPVALKLDGRRCVVVGSGETASPRVQSLREAGADVRHVTQFSSADLDGAWLVVLTDRDRELAARIAHACEERRIFYCAVDDPSVGSYAHLALARAGNVVLAIGTNGEAPALARRLRELFQALLARSGLAAFAERHAELRRKTPPERRAEVLGAHVRELRLDGELVLPPDGTDPAQSE